MARRDEKPVPPTPAFVGRGKRAASGNPSLSAIVV